MLLIGVYLFGEKMYINVWSRCVCVWERVILWFFIWSYRSFRRCCTGRRLIGGLLVYFCMRCYLAMPPLRQRMRMTFLSPSWPKRSSTRPGSAQMPWAYWKGWAAQCSLKESWSHTDMNCLERSSVCLNVLIGGKHMVWIKLSVHATMNISKQ